LLNPPADTTKDTDVIERRTVANILMALEGSGLEKVVAESTGGAQPRDRIGDLNVLWELEEGLSRRLLYDQLGRKITQLIEHDAVLITIRQLLSSKVDRGL
jgi:hypothetical protein